MNDDFVFGSHDELIAYLYTRFPEETPLSPLKLQKILYFLFAFYGGTVGNITDEDVENSDVSNVYPRYLFNARFEAWKYGPVIRDVYFKNKNNEYDELEEFDFSALDIDVLEFIDDLFLQLNDMGDFTLVQRSHMDRAWKQVYDSDSPYKSREMDNELIILDYVEEA